MTPQEQLHRNLTNHPPVSTVVVGQFECIRIRAKQLGDEMLEQCPPSRELSLALTSLEQATMWAIAAIARNQVADSTDGV